jgi:hypothetical protein
MSGDPCTLAQQIKEAADAVSSGAYTVQYTAFNGSYFDLVITDKNTGIVIRIHITKVG